MFTFCRSQIMIRCTSKIKWLKVAFSKLFIRPPSSDFWGIIFHGWRNMPANLTQGGANNNELCSPVSDYSGKQDWPRYISIFDQSLLCLYMQIQAHHHRLSIVCCGRR